MTQETKPSTRRRSEKTPIFRFIAFLVLPPITAMARIRLHGTENVPSTGAFVLTPNHYSEIDPLVTGVAIWKTGRVPRYLAKASLFRIPVVGSLLRASGQIPVERAGSSRSNDPLAAARMVAERGLVVVVYPEGSLTRDPLLWPMRGKSGAARIALEQNIPVIPMAHWGTQLLMPRYAKRLNVFPRKTIDVSFGAPVDLEAYRDRTLDSDTLALATNDIMQAITALFEELRGEKAPAERWDPSKNNQKETGRFD